MANSSQIIFQLRLDFETISIYFYFFYKLQQESKVYIVAGLYFDHKSETNREWDDCEIAILVLLKYEQIPLCSIVLLFCFLPALMEAVIQIDNKALLTTPQCIGLEWMFVMFFNKWHLNGDVILFHPWLKFWDIYIFWNVTSQHIFQYMCGLWILNGFTLKVKMEKNDLNFCHFMHSFISGKEKKKTCATVLRVHCS